jgi:hypothetical protein
MKSQSNQFGARGRDDQSMLWALTLGLPCRDMTIMCNSLLSIVLDSIICHSFHTQLFPYKGLLSVIITASASKVTSCLIRLEYVWGKWRCLKFVLKLASGWKWVISFMLRQYCPLVIQSPSLEADSFSAKPETLQQYHSALTLSVSYRHVDWRLILTLSYHSMDPFLHLFAPKTFKNVSSSQCVLQSPPISPSLTCGQRQIAKRYPPSPACSSTDFHATAAVTSRQQDSKQRGGRTDSRCGS